MYRSFGLTLLLITLSFSGCQDAEPSRIIVSLQIDSDGDQNWLYLYTIPRVKMDNLTIVVNGDEITLSSVFSNQRNFSNTDAEDFVSLKISADLSNIFWEYICEVRIYAGEVEDSFYVEISKDNDENVEDDLISYELPYNVPLNYKL